jgi:hypothetical protein
MKFAGETTLPADFDGADAKTRADAAELDNGFPIVTSRCGQLLRAVRREGFAPVRAGFGPIHTSHIKTARAIKRDFEEHVKDVIDPWLKDCPPLPRARAPQWNERGGR